MANCFQTKRKLTCSLSEGMRTPSYCMVGRISRVSPSRGNANTPTGQSKPLRGYQKGVQLHAVGGFMVCQGVLCS